MAGHDQKTEQPTPRRLDKARKEGQFPVSREVTAATQFVIFVWLALAYAPEAKQALETLLRGFLREGFRADLSASRFVHLVESSARIAVWPAALAAAWIVCAMAAVQVASTGFGISAAKLKPDFKRLNPLSRLSQLPSQNWKSLTQALLLVPLAGAVTWIVVSAELPAFLELHRMGLGASLALYFSSVRTLLLRLAMLLLVLAAIDWWRERGRWMAQMRMSKQEIRDEMKETEGNPMVKGRIRRLQRQMGRRRMMQEVEKATAVLVNPTHYAVALRYVPSEMSAPKVVAKGKNYLALRIRERAIRAQVPIVENPPLAQALYKGAQVGQDIPAHLYRAVAEVLAYIYRLTNGWMPGAVRS